MKKDTKQNKTLKFFCKKKFQRNDVNLVKNAMWDIVKKRKTCKKRFVKNKWMKDFETGFINSCMKRNSRKKPKNYS
jgi:hypothetical protein